MTHEQGQRIRHLIDVGAVLATIAENVAREPELSPQNRETMLKWHRQWISAMEASVGDVALLECLPRSYDPVLLGA